MDSFEIIFQTLAVFVGILFWTFIISQLISVVAGGGVSLVVKKLTIQTGVEAAARRVEIVGRREGIIAFCLTLVGLSPTTTLVVNKRESVCEKTGLLGIAHQSVPMDRVAQVTSGSKVAFEYIVSAVITGLVGVLTTVICLARFQIVALIGVPALTAIFVGVSLLLYSLNKRFYVGVFPQGGWPMLFAFKPNVIEGVELNLDRALEIAAIIRALAVDSRHTQMDLAPAPVAKAAGSQAGPVGQSSHSEEEARTIAQTLLRTAQNQIQSGQRDDAIRTLKQLVQQFAGTPEADQAARSLARAGVVA